MDKLPITTDQIYEEAMENKFDEIESQFEYITKNEWSEGDYIVLEAAMAMVASGYLDYKFDVKSGVKCLRVAIDSCKKSTYRPGEELSAMLGILKLTLHSKDEDIKAAMQNYLEQHIKLLAEYPD